MKQQIEFVQSNMNAEKKDENKRATPLVEKICVVNDMIIQVRVHSFFNAHMKPKRIGVYPC